MNKSIYVACLAAVFSACASSSLKKNTKKDLESIICNGSNVHVDDGDTIVCNGRNIRILGIDTPEIKHPEHCIMEDQPYGREAADYAERIFKNAKEIKVFTMGKDTYGRDLGHVFVDGELYAIGVLRNGLAYEVISFYGDGGFPIIAAQILEESQKMPELKFEPPYNFRGRMKALYVKDENGICVVKP